MCDLQVRHRLLIRFQSLLDRQLDFDLFLACRNPRREQVLHNVLRGEEIRDLNLFLGSHQESTLEHLQQ